MQKLIVFNHITLDGYFTDINGDMSWAHKQDEEWDAFTRENAGSGGTLIFGRKTYDLMNSFWPTPAAMQQMPDIAKRMNDAPKVVFSTTLNQANWQNTTLIKTNITEEIHKLKQQPGKGLVVLGSGSIVAQLAGEHLIDEYHLVLNPIAIGSGRSLFEGLVNHLSLQLDTSRIFGNSNILLRYLPAK